jgi:hypothetical protein
VENRTVFVANESGSHDAHELPAHRFPWHGSRSASGEGLQKP